MRRKLLFTGIPLGLVILELLLALLLSFLISNSIYVTILVDFLFAVGLGVWYYRKMRHPVGSRQFGTGRLVGLLLLQFPIWLLGQIVATYLIQLQPDLYAEQSQVFSETSRFFYILLSVCMAPVTEELLFRGVWFSCFRKAWGVIPAIVFSALSFSVLHGNLPQGYVTFLMGLFYGICIEYTGRLWVVILLHISANILDGMSSLLLVPSFFIEPWFFIPVNLLCIVVLLVFVVRARKHVVVKSDAVESSEDRPVLADVHEGVYEKTDQDENERDITLK